MLGQRWATVGPSPGHGWAITRPWSGHGGAIARPLVRTAGGEPPVSRRLQRPYSIRGWCLTQLNGFQFQKAAGDRVRMNVPKW